MGVIDAELDAVLIAGGVEFSQGIATESACLGDIVVVDFRVEHRHAVMVHRSNDDIAHASVLRGANPLVGIEGSRIERLHDLFKVGVAFDFCYALDVLGVALDLLASPFACQRGVDAPVDEHAKAGLAPPGQAVGFFIGWRHLSSERGINRAGHKGGALRIRMDFVGEQFGFACEGGVHVNEPHIEFSGQFFDPADFLYDASIVDSKSA